MQLHIFLKNMSKHIDEQWPKFEGLINRAIYGQTQDAEVMELLKTYCKSGKMLVSVRNERVLEKKQALVAKSANADLQESAKLVHVDIQLLRQACERGITQMDMIRSKCTSEVFELERKELGKLQHIAVNCEIQINNANVSINAIMRVTKAGGFAKKVGANGISPTNGKGKKRSLNSAGSSGVGKVNTGKKRKSGVTGKKGSANNKSPEKPEEDGSGSKKTHATSTGSGGGHGPIVFLQDQRPERLVNPLLEIPQGSMVGDPTLPVSEYLKLMEVYFPEPDTFPLSYYAKLLGLELPPASDKKSKKKQSATDEWTKVPSLGKYAKVPTRLCNDTLEIADIDGSRRDRDFDNVDPTWTGILNDYRGYRDDYLKAASEMNKPCILSEECLLLAKEMEIIGDHVHFSVAVPDDVPLLSALNQVSL